MCWFPNNIIVQHVNIMTSIQGQNLGMIYYNLQGQTALALLDPEDKVTMILPST